MPLHQQTESKMNRRKMLKGLALLSGLAILPLRVFAEMRAAFTAEAPEAALKELFGDKPIEQSDAIKLKIPDIAENGAVVPVSISTEIEGVESISIIIDQNPNPLSASFTIGEDVFADVSTRVKMGKSSQVRAMVETSDKIYTVGKEVKVTIGGCGG